MPTATWRGGSSVVAARIDATGGVVLAAVIRSPAAAAMGPLELVDLPEPVAADGEIVLDVEACALCRTDLQIAEGDLPPHRLPIVPGHQAVGRVRSIGHGVTGVHAGERRGVPWLGSTCGRCRFCAGGRENLCEQALFTGWDRDGGLAERMAVRADVTAPLPDEIDPVAVAPLLCGGAIGLRSMRVAEVRPGCRLGLFGFGASATCVLQIAVSWNCEVAVSSRSEADRRRARDLGAVWTGDLVDRPPFALDAAITTAPVGDAIVAALRALDRGGIVAVNAIHLDHVPEFDYELLWWERQLRSVANVSRADVLDVLELARAIPIRTQVEEYPLVDVGSALARLAAGDVRGAAVLRMADLADRS
jgi:propanol-preferring alcohol dehydrogenase